MTKEELKKYKQPNLDVITIPVEIVDEHLEDEYGIYETGIYLYDYVLILINKELGKWHLYVYERDTTIDYFKLRDIRYKFMPDNMKVAHIFPNRNEIDNTNKYCFHLYEL